MGIAHLRKQKTIYHAALRYAFGAHSFNGISNKIPLPQKQILIHRRIQFRHAVSCNINTNTRKIKNSTLAST